MLKAIYTTGSSLILKSPSDKDVVRFYETKEECIEAVKKHKRDKNLDEHFSYVGREPMVFLGCYIYPFMELVEGEDLHLNDFSIFDHKKEYADVLKRFASWLPHDHKWWYHILTACYMFKNNSYDLTEAQLKAIQSTHDNGITNAKYNLCIDVLNEIE